MKKIIELKNAEWIAFLLGAVLVILYLYSNVWFEGYKLSNTNLMYDSEPWNSYGVETEGPVLSDSVDSLLPSVYGLYQKDSIGLWNKDLALGAEEEVSYLIYPLYYLFALPLEYAVILRSIIKFALGFIGMYFLCREYRLNRWISAFAGISYTFSSFCVMWHFWPHSDAAVFTPFLILFTKRMVDRINIKDMLLTAVFMALMLVSGMPTVAAYAIYLAGAYVLFMAPAAYWKNKKKILHVYLLFGISVLITVLLSAPYTISLVTSVSDNGYAGSRTGQATQILEFKYLRTLIFPYFREALSSHENEATLFIGIPALAALILTPVRFFKKKNIKFWSIACAVVFLLIFTHVFDFIFTRLPAVNTSLKFRLISLFVFIAPLIAAMNIQDIVSNVKVYKNKIGFYILCAAAILGMYCLKFSWMPGFGEPELFYSTLVVIIITAVLIGLLFIVKDKYICLIFLTVCVVSSVGFAKEYLPMIDKDSPIIPEATDTIKFLQKNTENEERIYPIGDWTLFGNSNVYYDLNSINTHNFVNTNSDMQAYMTNIDDDFYTTATRTAAQDVENINLLKYLGVKYIVGSADENGWQPDTDSGLTPVGFITDGCTVSQEFTCDREGLVSIKFMAATYSEVLEEGHLFMKLERTDNNQAVAEEIIELSSVQDNSMVPLEFDIQMSDNVAYRLSITTDITDEKPFTVYMVNGDAYSGELTVDGESVNGDLFIQVYYSTVDYVEGVKAFEGNDGLTVIELDEYTDKVELAENVIVASEADILDKMKAGYEKNVIYLPEDAAGAEYAYSEKELADSEWLSIEAYKDDYVKVRANIDQARFLILNDYYNENWKVYVDGEPAELDKANYLMRAVYIQEAGEHIIEFKYHPDLTIILLYISAVTAAAVILFFVFAEVIQKRSADRKNRNICRTGRKTMEEQK